MKINTINPITFTGTVKANILDSHGNSIPQQNLYNIEEYNTLASPEFLDLDINIERIEKPIERHSRTEDKYKIVLAKGSTTAESSVWIDKATKQSAREATIRQSFFFDTLKKLFEKSIAETTRTETEDTGENLNKKIKINLNDRNGNPISQEKLKILKECKKLSDLYNLEISVKESKYFTFPMITQRPYMVFISRPLETLHTVIQAEAPVLVDKKINQPDIERKILEGIYNALINLTQKSAKALINAKK